MTRVDILMLQRQKRNIERGECRKKYNAVLYFLVVSLTVERLSLVIYGGLEN